MDYEKVFKRIHEKANYAKVEDTINELAKSLDTDSKEVGYGIARNTVANFGDSEDLTRLEKKISGVSNELAQVSKGVSEFDMIHRRIAQKPKEIINDLVHPKDLTKKTFDPKKNYRPPNSYYSSKIART